MLGLLLVAGLARAAETLPTGVPEPVRDLALADLRAERTSRIALALGVAAPGALVFGGLSYPRGDDGERGVQRIGASAAIGIGVVGMFLSPVWLDNRAQASRAHLRSQGLSVRRPVPRGVVPLLTLLGPSLVMGGVAEESSALMIGGGVVYATALGLGVAQQRINGRARSEAPWLVAAPVLDRDAPGFAVGGAW